MGNISDRIAQIIKGQGLSTRAFEQQIGCSNGVISKCINKGTDISSQWVSKIIETFVEINPRWLLTGEGEMLQGENGRKVETAHQVPEGSDEGIPLLPISAMAGAFTGEVTVMEYECERYVIPAFKGADFMIRVTGDSMFPTYRSGDLVACQRVPLEDLFFQWNKVYVLDTVQGPLIKRIKRGTDPNHILIVSDNTDYDPYEITRNQFNGVALVRGIVRIE